MEISTLQQSDYEWFSIIFKHNEKELNCDLEQTWNDKSGIWLCIRPYAFLHYDTLRDNCTNIIKQLAVHKDFQGKGIGSLLVKQIKPPIMVATYNAQKFYSKLGFISFGQVLDKQGKILDVYIKE